MVEAVLNVGLALSKDGDDGVSGDERCSVERGLTSERGAGLGCFAG